MKTETKTQEEPLRGIEKELLREIAEEVNKKKEKDLEKTKPTIKTK